MLNNNSQSSDTDELDEKTSELLVEKFQDMTSMIKDVKETFTELKQANSIKKNNEVLKHDGKGRKKVKKTWIKYSERWR